MATNYNNTSGADLAKLLIERNLFKQEDIVLDGQKIKTPERAAAIDMLKQYDIDNAPKTYPVFDKEDKEIKQVTEADGIADTTLEAIKDTEGNLIHFTQIDVPPPPQAVSNDDWSQEAQANPNRYYVIAKVSTGVKDGKKTYEELPQYFVNGRWCEDDAGSVECSFYDNLRPEVIEEYRSKGIIR